MVIRDKIFSTITSVFKRHGAVTIDTSAYLDTHSAYHIKAYAYLQPSV